jgi:hypothetical protein
MAEGKYQGMSGTLDSSLVQKVFNEEFAAIVRRRGLGRK